MTYAIGDIHGCRSSFETLLEAVRPGPGDTLVILGDFVDRGPDTRGVIERLMELRHALDLVVLRGNHEEIMLQALQNRQNLRFWKQVGGEAVLRSYDVSQPEDIPASHWTFLEETLLYHETQNHIFVHACLDPDLDLKDQADHTLLWLRFEDMLPHHSGKRVVCGHTPQEDGKPSDLGFAICIDTNVCRGGWLTCLAAERGAFWQANEDGVIRRDSVESLFEY